MSGLWQVHSYHFNQRVEPNGAWWFNNRVRGGKGVAILQYSVRGKMIYRDRHGTREVPAGHAAMFLLGEDSYYGCPAHIREPYFTQFVSFAGAGLPEHWNLMRERTGSVFWMGEDNPLRGALQQLCERPRPQNTQEVLLAASEVYAILIRLHLYLLARSEKEKPPVDRAVDEILGQAAAAGSMKEIAARHGCSREHLSRIFTERTGTSPARYLAQVRLAKALDLLRETGLPVSRVAEQCGFTSTHTLARHVRRMTGKPPAEFRERHARQRARSRTIE